MWLQFTAFPALGWEGGWPDGWVGMEYEINAKPGQMAWAPEPVKKGDNNNMGM